jgi:hypothetical protein
MLTRLAARTLTSPPRATLSSLGIVSSPGLPSARTPCQDAEVEYRAMANGAAEATRLRQLLLELHAPLRHATLVY